MKRYILPFLIIAILPGCAPPIISPIILKGVESGVNKLIGIDPKVGSGEALRDCQECIQVHVPLKKGVIPNPNLPANDYVQEYLREYNLTSEQRKLVEDCLRYKGYLGQAQ